MRLDPRSSYLWNAPVTQEGRRALAARLHAGGCRQLWLKAGGDGGHAWIPGEKIPFHAPPQWNAHWVADFAPLEVLPWFYVHPTIEDVDAIVRALGVYRADTLVLNPETEWRGGGQAIVMSFVSLLRGRLAAHFGQAFAIGFSGVPSWVDFPYEAFAEECDFAHPQHYWFPDELAQGKDQVALHYERSPGAAAGKPCHPILAASREKDDVDVVNLAHYALLHPVQGLSAWEAGNNAFQLDAMARAWALLKDAAPVAGTSRTIAALERLLTR